MTTQHLYGLKGLEYGPYVCIAGTNTLSYLVSHFFFCLFFCIFVDALVYITYVCAIPNRVFTSCDG